MGLDGLRDVIIYGCLRCSRFYYIRGLVFFNRPCGGFFGGAIFRMVRNLRGFIFQVDTA